MFRRLTYSIFTTCLLSFAGGVQAEPVTLYLLNGTVVRGEIVDRSSKVIALKTPSGDIKVKTASLMPISRQQLKLPAEVEKEVPSKPEMDAVLAQMEKILAENESLKAQVEKLKTQLAIAQPTLAEPPSPAEGPAVKR